MNTTTTTALDDSATLSDLTEFVFDRLPPGFAVEVRVIRDGSTCYLYRDGNLARCLSDGTLADQVNAAVRVARGAARLEV